VEKEVGRVTKVDLANGNEKKRGGVTCKAHWHYVNNEGEMDFTETKTRMKDGGLCEIAPYGDSCHVMV